MPTLEFFLSSVYGASLSNSQSRESLGTQKTRRNWRNWRMIDRSSFLTDIIVSHNYIYIIFVHLLDILRKFKKMKSVTKKHSFINFKYLKLVDFCHLRNKLSYSQNSWNCQKLWFPNILERRLHSCSIRKAIYFANISVRFHHSFSIS